MKALLASLILIFTVSCKFTFPDSITSQYESNPFLEAYDISAIKTSDSVLVGPDDVNKVENNTELRFAVITDVHIDRDKEVSDVKYFHDNFYSFLDSDKPKFLLCLGDLTDKGEYNDEVKSFISESAKRTENKWFVYCIGNHERRIFDSEKWNMENSLEHPSDNGWDLINFSGTMGKYVYGDLLSIYKLDSSMRILGQQQLSWLEEALKQDKSKYRIIIGHDNITTGGELDQSLFLFGFGDIQERNKLYRIMDEYKIGVVLSGHHHKGNIEYHMSEYMGELNLAAYHQRKFMDLESEGYFYEAILDAESGILTVNGYLAEYTKDKGREPDKSFYFKLPKAD